MQTAKVKADPVREGSTVQLSKCDVYSSLQAWTIESGKYPDGRIKLRNSGQTAVLDIIHALNESTAQVRVWQEESEAWMQQWTYSSSTGRIQSSMNQMCLSVIEDYGLDGAPVVMRACNLGKVNQWEYSRDTGRISSYLASGYCLDAGTAYNCSQLSDRVYCNPDAPIEARLDDLVPRINPAQAAQLLFAGSSWGVGLLGIPPFTFGEALHGVLATCGKPFDASSTGCPTSFPHALMLGASFNRSLWRQVGMAISFEARGLGNQAQWGGGAAWAPDINLFRDPRWGRGQEVPGEDPVLNSEYAFEYVTGLYGLDDEDYIRVVATPKHFSAYDLENWNGTTRSAFNAIVSFGELVEYFWPAFRSAIERGGARSVMCSYNAVTVRNQTHASTGIPSCANSFFNNDIIRGEWGFDGFIASDCGAVQNIMDPHQYASSLDAAVGDAVRGGTDVNCGYTYKQNMLHSVVSGNLTVAAVQQAARRYLRQVIRLGAMDPPERNPYLQLGPEVVDTPAHRELALDAARQGIILLQNQGGVLPLDASKLSSIAMIGPHANASYSMLSNYHGTNTLVDSHSPLLAMQRLAPSTIVQYAQGCDIRCNETSGFADAGLLARTSDAAVVFLGLDYSYEAEGLDRTSIDLPGQQLALLYTVARAIGPSKPLVVVFMHGGVLGDAWIKANVPAIVDAHYPGELGGDAIAEVLLGQTNPSGRVTTTWYASDITSKRSMFDMSIKPHDDVPGLTYMFYGPEDGAIWEFGDGLSYTTFDVQWASGVGAAPMAVAGSDVASGVQEMSYTVNVTNTGSVAGAWSVLGFVTPTGGEGLRVSGARRELFDFDRTAVLAPGKSQVLHLTIPASVLASADEDGELVVREGSYEVQIEGLRAGIEVGRGTGATVFSVTGAGT